MNKSLRDVAQPQGLKFQRSTIMNLGLVVGPIYLDYGKEHQN